MPDDYASERYNPTLPHCGQLALRFDGRNLTMTGSGPPKTYSADSGRPIERNGQITFDYSQARQRIRNVGPIPEGTYWIRPDELSEAGWFRNTDAWGDYRITIHPFTTTETFGRGGFFIHGGTTRGSAGCIDLCGRINQFVR